MMPSSDADAVQRAMLAAIEDRGRPRTERTLQAALQAWQASRATVSTSDRHRTIGVPCGDMPWPVGTDPRSASPTSLDTSATGALGNGSVTHRSPREPRVEDIQPAEPEDDPDVAGDHGLPMYRCRGTDERIAEGGRVRNVSGWRSASDGRIDSSMRWAKAAATLESSQRPSSRPCRLGPCGARRRRWCRGRTPTDLGRDASWLVVGIWNSISSTPGGSPSRFTASSAPTDARSPRTQGAHGQAGRGR
jgi:hypothetical protein